MAAVLMGQELRIDGFHADSGFWGTNFLNSALYGMGNDAAALTTVCIFWFAYGAAILGSLTAAILSLRSRRA